MYFVGVSLSPMGWLMVIVAALFALALPFAVIGSIVSPLPEPFATAAEMVLGYVGFPLLLCYLHSRKMLGRGMGSAFFHVYTWVYLLVGLIAAAAAFFAEGGFNIDGFLFGVVMVVIGAGMIWWSRRTSAALYSKAEEAMANQAAQEREEDIQRQTEAILRADELRKE